MVSAPLCQGVNMRLQPCKGQVDVQRNKQCGYAIMWRPGETHVINILLIFLKSGVNPGTTCAQLEAGRRR